MTAQMICVEWLIFAYPMIENQREQIATAQILFVSLIYITYKRGKFFSRKLFLAKNEETKQTRNVFTSFSLCWLRARGKKTSFSIRCAFWLERIFIVFLAFAQEKHTFLLIESRLFAKEKLARF